MVPVESRAFGLLALCVILLAAAHIIQWLPGRTARWGKPVIVALVLLAVALALLVFSMTAQ